MLNYYKSANKMKTGPKGVIHLIFILFLLTGNQLLAITNNDVYFVVKNGSEIPLTPLSNDSGTWQSILKIDSIALNAPGTPQSIFLTGGEVKISASGAMTFSPANNYTGTVRFSYTARDEADLESRAYVVIVVYDTIDTDGDGVLDYFDLDDDNDGILDVDEMDCVTDFNIRSSWSYNDGTLYPDYNVSYENIQAATYFMNASELAFGSGVEKYQIKGEDVFDFELSGINETTYLEAKANGDYMTVSYTPAKDINVRGFNMGFAFPGGIAVSPHKSHLGQYKVAVEYSSFEDFSTSVLLFENMQIPDFNTSSETEYVIKEKIFTNNEGALLAGTTYYFRIYLYDVENNYEMTDPVIPLNSVVIDDFYFINRSRACVPKDRHTDTDNVFDRIDLDTDGDECPDAIEGDADFTDADLNPDKSLEGAVDADGIPVKAGEGQGIGDSRDSAISICSATAVDDQEETYVNDPVSGNVLTNDTNLTIVTEAKQGSTSIQIGVLTPISQGTITINGDGSYLFTPETDYIGLVPTITYTATNIYGISAEANLNIEVIPGLPNYWHGTESTDWDNQANWTAHIVPASGDDIEFATATNNAGDPAERDLYLDQDRIIGDLINASDKNLIVTTGNMLTINGKVKDDYPTAGTIIVKSDIDEPTGTLLFDDPANNRSVQAIVEFYNKAYDCDCGFFTRAWQYFGIPVKSSAFPYQNPISETVNQWVESYDGDKWRPVLELKAFEGYEITNSSKSSPTHIYEFSGVLHVGDTTLNISKTTDVNYSGMNLIGNSYTAAIPISADAIDFSGTWANSEKTVYLFNAGTRDQWRKLNGASVTHDTQAGQYKAVPMELAGRAGLIDRIPSMHTFMINAGASGTLSLAYDKLVKNLSVDGMAWRSEPLGTEQFPYIVLDVIGANSADRVWLFENAVTTRNFDNGWDGYKIEEEGIVQVYVLGDDDKYQVATVPDLNNTTIGLIPDNDEEYTLSLSVMPEVESRNLYLYDRLTGSNYIIRDNAEYVISGAKGASDKRFVVVSEPNARGLDEALSSVEIAVGNGMIHVTNFSEEDCVATVYDFMGRNLMQTPVKQSTVASMNTSRTLQSGLYIVKVYGQTISKTKRIVVK